MDFRRVARGAAWAAAAVAILIVGLWLVVVAINRRDEAPSADALRLERVIAGRPAVDHAANAYVLLLGLGVDKDEDSFAWGVRRMAFLEASSAGTAASGGAAFPGTDVDIDARRSEFAGRMVDTCRQADRGCWLLLRQHPEQLEGWLQSEAWLLERYRGLIALRQWRESIPTQSDATFAPYMPAMEGQRLLLMKAFRHARLKDAVAARDLLQADLEFWRMVLRSSDILVSKMIATAAIQRHFAMGNLVLRELGEGGVDATPPAAWGMPFDRGERSMLRAYAGEWRFFSSSVVDATLREEGPREALSRHLFGPLLKPVATSNLFAANMVRLIEGVDVAWTDLPAAAHTLALQPDEGLPSAYNPVGDILSRVGYPAYLPYALRVSDLEGTRRATLLAIALRNEGRTNRTASALAKAISDSPLKEPYRDEPFAWDEATGSIVFQGLAPHPRGRSVVLL